MARRADLLTWAVVLGSFSVGYVSNVLRSVLYFPDSRYYLAMAYLFGGESPESARELTQEFMEPRGIPLPDVDLLFGWGLVQPRVLLPLLSALPVKLFGPYGLAGVVLVIHVVLTVVMTLILQKRFGNAATITVMLLMNLSVSLMSFNSGMLTESFSALWTALTLMAGWWWIESRRRTALVLVAITVIASAFTRQATFIVAGAFVAAWLLGSLFARRNSPWMWPAIVAVVSSLGSQVFQTLVFPNFSQANQFLRMTGTDTVGEAILTVPSLVWKILFTDLANFAYKDVSLLVFILLSIAGLVLLIRSEESHLLLGAIAGVALYNITNGNATGFRYAVPGLIFYALVVALLLRNASSKLPPPGTEGSPERKRVEPDPT